MRLAIGRESRIRRVDVRVEARSAYHPQQSVLNPHRVQRQTACMRYISRAATLAQHLVQLRRVESSAARRGRRRDRRLSAVGRFGSGGRADYRSSALADLALQYANRYKTVEETTGAAPYVY